MLSRAAAAQNDRELQAPRGQPESKAPREQGQDAQAPRGGNTPSASGSPDTVPPQMKRAAMLVKEADTACQACNTAEASQKAKAAMVLMQQQ